MEPRDDIEADESVTPPGRRHGFPTAIGALGLFLAWVPGLGLLLSLAALVMGIAARRRGEGSRFAVVVAVFALLLGAGFTGAYLACTPSVETAEERKAWEEFDALFHEGAEGAHPPVPGPATAPGPGRTDVPPAPPAEGVRPAQPLDSTPEEAREEAPPKAPSPAP